MHTRTQSNGIWRFFLTGKRPWVRNCSWNFIPILVFSDAEHYVSSFGLFRPSSTPGEFSLVLDEFRNAEKIGEDAEDESDCRAAYPSCDKSLIEMMTVLADNRFIKILLDTVWIRFVRSEYILKTDEMDFIIHPTVIILIIGTEKH